MDPTGFPVNDHAVVFIGPNEVSLESVERPKEVPMRSVLIEARSTLVSVGTELAMLKGTHIGFKTGAESYPFRPGYSFAGVVKEAGFGTYGISEGDRVFCTGRHGSFTVVNSSKSPVVKLPPTLDFERASFAHLGAISLHGVIRAELRDGDSVAVIGQGLVGNLALQLTKLRGAGQAIGIDRNELKLDKSAVCGATSLLLSKDPRLFEKVRDLTHGAGANVVIEATGDPSAVDTACRMCSNGGRVVLLGGSRGLASFDFYSTVHKKDLKVIGAHSSNVGLEYPERGFTLGTLLDQVLRQIASGELIVGPLITHRVGWREIPDFYKRLAAAPSGHLGIVLDWSPLETHTSERVLATNRGATRTETSGAGRAPQEKVGFAIVGCGFISQVHAEAVAKSSHCELRAVMDVDESKARHLGEKYHVPWYSNMDDLFREQGVSVIDVCTPPQTHSSIAERAAAHGKHVLVEKPIETDLDKADAMISCCDKAGVKLGVVYQHRFRPNIKAVEAAFTKGQFGRMFLASFQDRSSRKRDYFDASDWRREVLLQFIGEGIHGIDLVQHYMGQVDRVSAYGAGDCPGSTRSQNTIVCCLTFSSGALGSLEFTTSAFPSLDSRLELHGTEGSAVIEGTEARTWRFLRPVVRPASTGQTSDFAKLRRGAIRKMKRQLRFGSSSSEAAAVQWYGDHVPVLDDFADSVLHSRKPKVDGLEARKSLEIVLACDESIRSEASVRLPLSRSAR